MTEKNDNHRKRSDIMVDNLQELKKLTIKNFSQFKKHPNLCGVQTLSLSFEHIPNDIKKLLQNIWQVIVSFSAIKILNNLPQHKHIDDWDIYFWWSWNIFVDVFDKNNIKTTIKLWNTFVITYPKESHGITNNSTNEELFFSIKFENK